MNWLILLLMTITTNFGLAATSTSNQTISPSAIQAQSPSAIQSQSQNQAQTQPNNPNTNADLANQFVKQLLASVQKDHLQLNFDFDISMKKDDPNPAKVNALAITAVTLFKNNPEGILVPISAVEPNMSSEEKSLVIYAHIDLSNKYGILNLKKTANPNTNEYEGQLRFYSKDLAQKKLFADYVLFELNSEILDIKKIFLYGAHIKIQMPESTQTAAQTKDSIIKALITCEAETETVDIFAWKMNRTPLEKCLFQLDDQQIRIQYKETQPSYAN